MDTSVDPGVDFFQYANGGWLKRNPIPESEAHWGIGDLVQEQLYTTLRKINEEASQRRPLAGSDQQKIGDFWAIAMDTSKAERSGVHPLDSELGQIDKVASIADVLDVAFALHQLRISALFDLYVDVDEKNSREWSIHLGQGGLGLPDRDFYVNPDTGVARVREEYMRHMARLLTLLGQSKAEASVGAANVIAFETSLAKASRKLEDVQDPVLNYHRMTPAELTDKYTPSITWADRFAAWNVHPEFVAVGQPEFFTALEGLVHQTPVRVLRDYLRLRLISRYSEYLSKVFEDEDFKFDKQVLSGQNAPRPRWKRVIDAENAEMGLVSGKIFAEQYFPKPTKERYVALVEAIRSAYHDRIEALDWMSDSTKAKAQQKLEKMTMKVGYPDKWKDYSGLVIGRESYATNMMSADRWRFNDRLSKVGQPVDRTERGPGMPPQTYDAAYSQGNNDMVFPAAIFTVPGVADEQIDDAVAYVGGILAARWILRPQHRGDAKRQRQRGDCDAFVHCVLLGVV